MLRIVSHDTASSFFTSKIEENETFGLLVVCVFLAKDATAKGKKEYSFGLLEDYALKGTWILQFLQLQRVWNWKKKFQTSRKKCIEACKLLKLLNCSQNI